ASHGNGSGAVVLRGRFPSHHPLLVGARLHGHGQGHVYGSDARARLRAGAGALGRTGVTDASLSLDTMSLTRALMIRRINSLAPFTSDGCRRPRSTMWSRIAAVSVADRFAIR